MITMFAESDVATRSSVEGGFEISVARQCELGSVKITSIEKMRVNVEMIGQIIK